jgi:hypothetical protein
MKSPSSPFRKISWPGKFAKFVPSPISRLSLAVEHENPAIFDRPGASCCSSIGNKPVPHIDNSSNDAAVPTFFNPSTGLVTMSVLFVATHVEAYILTLLGTQATRLALISPSKRQQKRLGVSRGDGDTHTDQYISRNPFGQHTWPRTHSARRWWCTKVAQMLSGRALVPRFSELCSEQQFAPGQPSRRG